MHLHMKAYNEMNVIDGVHAVKKGYLSYLIIKLKKRYFFSDLQAFIYDGTVLEYLVGQDDECRLLTVGSWYAMTGYGVAFPRNSKHFASVNRKIMDYSENGNTGFKLHVT